MCGLVALTTSSSLLTSTPVQRVPTGLTRAPSSASSTAGSVGSSLLAAGTPRFKLCIQIAGKEMEC